MLLALASCAPKLVPPEAPPPTKPVERVAVPRPAEPKPAGPQTAREAGVRAGPSLSGVTVEQADRAYRAFKISCPALTRREDASGLTRPSDWAPLCAQTDTMAQPRDMYLRWFRDNFELVEVGDGKAFATGYFEPEITGCRTPRPGCDVPVYRKPPDLVEVDAAAAAAAGTPRRGRMENGAIIPYAERSQIEDGALAGRGLEIGWAADAIEFFFLQIQGSGRLRMADGSVMRIGYAGQNGREYVGIGKLMKDRGLLGPGQTTMQGIVAWLRANPEQGRAIMRENKSYIFFQELTGPGPLGALGLPVTGRASVAADPKYVPLGAPVLLEMDRPEASGLWIAQDTGGAIKGSNRFDTFWGAGEEAARIAGGMQGRGRAWILVPKGTLGRLGATPQP
ncbi:MAG TPA: murein transglycosylase A [Allosphingosinicella sp.]|nr:murein transglycosylase A [Allosphingosinicella sp.]